MLKDTILAAAIKLARKQGFANITREEVAEEAQTATGSINYHFEDMEGLRAAVVDFAIEFEIIEVLAQARAARHPRLTGRLTPALKERVATYITK